MLDEISIKMLEYLTAGQGHKRVADILGMAQEDYLKLFYQILITTKCWDELQLGMWWEEHRHEYVVVDKGNVTSMQS